MPTETPTHDACLKVAEHNNIDPAHVLDTRIPFKFVVQLAHNQSAKGGWWHDLETGQRKERNPGEMIALIHSEISEALEGVRKDKMDDHLPHRKSEEVEMADALIRIFDYCGGRGLDVVGAFYEKLAYNATRADHKIENRKKADGKKI